MQSPLGSFCPTRRAARRPTTEPAGGGEPGGVVVAPRSAGLPSLPSGSSDQGRATAGAVRAKSVRLGRSPTHRLRSRGADDDRGWRAALGYHRGRGGKALVIRVRDRGFRGVRPRARGRCRRGWRRSWRRVRVPGAGGRRSGGPCRGPRGPRPGSGGGPAGRARGS